MRYRDYEEFVASLNEHGVRYLIVGAHAVALYARPRATKDMDFLIEPTPDNARKLLAAIRAFFGGSDLGLTVDDFTDPENIVQLGVAPTRIDLLGSLSGLPAFDSAWQRRTQATYGDEQASYLSLEDLIATKEAAGRDQDRADLRGLRRVLNKRSS